MPLFRGLVGLGQHHAPQTQSEASPLAANHRLHLMEPAEGPPGSTRRYLAPGWFTRRVFNPGVAGLTRLGISVWGSRVLEVQGRKSGEPRRVPVNPVIVDGKRYLVAPRGHTQWVRNLRVAAEGDLLVGRRRESFVATELLDGAKEPILRAYLRRWKWEVGQFFDGVDAHSTSSEFARIAPDHPIFSLEMRSASDT